MAGLRPGQRVGDLVVDSLIGVGRSSEVYLVARDDGTWWAMKRLLHADRTRADRLAREAVVRSHLRHPHIVPAHAVVDAAGAPALLMDFVEGPSLRAWLDHHRPDVPQAVAIAAGIAQGVAAAHAAGVWHRDLRPESVMLQPRADGGWLARVSDWGLAHTDDVGPMGGLTTVERPLGTPGYAAPEQLRDATRATAASDVFALGCILYELITGRGPFAGRTELDAARAAARREYEPIPVDAAPQALVALIDAALDPDPTRRPADAGEWWARLHAVSFPAPTTPASTALVAAAVPAVVATVIGWLVSSR